MAATNLLRGRASHALGMRRAGSGLVRAEGCPRRGVRYEAEQFPLFAPIGDLFEDQLSSYSPPGGFTPLALGAFVIVCGLHVQKFRTHSPISWPVRFAAMCDAHGIALPPSFSPMASALPVSKEPRAVAGCPLSPAAAHSLSRSSAIRQRHGKNTIGSKASGHGASVGSTHTHI